MFSTSLFDFFKSTKLSGFRFSFTSGFVTNSLITHFTRSFGYFAASYAAIASSASLANTLSPLVRDVGIDIMSSALNCFALFKVEFTTTTCLHITLIYGQNQTAPFFNEHFFKFFSIKKNSFNKPRTTH